MQYVTNFLYAIFGIIKSFRPNDLIDIIIISFLIYWLSRLVMETRAAQLVKGIALLVLFYLVSELLKLQTVGLLLSNIFNLGVITLLVLFQPELRRALEKVGRTRVGSFSVFRTTDEGQLRQMWIAAIDNITKAVDNLAREYVGALIVIEREIKLGEQISNGIVMNADISVELLGNIFVNKSPLHDGAAIIRDARILAAACFLPRPSKEEYIARDLGSRHRAAIGMSENSDAIIIVVSEETGVISIAENGVLTRGFNKNSLYDYLRLQLTPVLQNEEEKKEVKEKKEKREKKSKKDDK